MTVAGFAVFGVGLAWLCFLVVPMIRLSSANRDEVRTRTRRAMRRFARRFMGALRAFGLMTSEGFGREHLPANDAYILAANHPTLIDAPFLLAEIPDLECIAKHQLARSFLFRHVFKAGDYLTNEHPVEMTDLAIERLRGGTKLLIFPEGTRSGERPVSTLKPGAAAMAVRAGCPIVPVTLTCDPPTLSYVNPWYRIPRRRVKLAFSIHRPIVPNSTLNRRDATAELNAELTRIMVGKRGRSAQNREGNQAQAAASESLRETASS